MSSVTRRIRAIRQPRGGYIHPSWFKVRNYDDNFILSECENIDTSIVGMVVDYLTRFIMGTRVEDAFKISCQGALIADGIKKGALNKAYKLLSGIKGIDDESIINACKLVTFDVWYRNQLDAVMAKGADEINPDENTINNIKAMVERSIVFWNKYGPIVKDGFSFEPDGYTDTVSSGDGDYLTADTIWDFKVSKYPLTSSHTLQLLMYWIMGQHSGQEVFKNISKLGIFNPRLNKMYRLSIGIVSKETIKIVERDVICY